MTRHHVYIPDYLTETALEQKILGDIADIHPLNLTSEDGFLAHAPKADAILLYHDIPLSQASISLMARCKGIVRCGVGYNNVDLAAAGKMGILVCNVPDYGTEDVADHALMSMLAISRKLVDNHLAIVNGGWEPAIIFGAPRMRGRTAGILGCGRIGTAMALRCKALGLNVIYYDPYARPGLDKALGIVQVHSLEEFLGKCDFVSLHCPLTTKTHHILNAKTLAMMKPTAYLINTARGPVVDNEALLNALDRGHLAAAALDVTDPEPPFRIACAPIPNCSCPRMSRITVTPALSKCGPRGPKKPAGCCLANRSETSSIAATSSPPAARCPICLRNDPLEE